MKTALNHLFLALIKFVVVIVLPLVLVVLLTAGRFAVFTVAPALALTALALVSGLVRTTALGVFGLAALMRTAMVAIERLGDRVPSPRMPWEVAR